MKAEAAAKREEIEMKEKERNMPVDDSEMIGKLFGFLPDQSPEGETIGGKIPLPREDEDLSDYKFSKFAQTYFQGQATHAYIKRPLRQALLGLKNEQDRQAALDIWVMILRFMGDLPEPKLTEIPADHKSESLAKRLYGSISRKLGASKQLQEGIDAEVSEEYVYDNNVCITVLSKLFRSLRGRKLFLWLSTDGLSSLAP